MKKIVFALAAAAALALSVPVSTPAAAASDGSFKVAQADVSVRVGGDRAERRRRGVTKKVIIKRGDRGLHRGWAHSRHRGATKKVIIKRGGEGRTVKKVIKRGED